MRRRANWRRDRPAREGAYGGHVPAPGTRPLLFVVRVIRRMIEAYRFKDHRLPVKAYLLHEKFRIAEESATRLVAVQPSGAEIVASFDTAARLTQLDMPKIDSAS